jgi:ABC-2 type transport system permease protein
VRDAWTIALKDLRRRIRDRTTLLVAVILPFAMAMIFSQTLSGVGGDRFEANLAVANEDLEGTLPLEFTELLKSLDFVRLETTGSAAAADALATAGEIDAAIVFPAGFSRGVEAGGGGTIEVIGSPDSSIGALVATSLARSFVSELNAVGLSVAMAGSQQGGAVDPAVVARARAIPPAAEIRPADAEDQVASESTFFAIGMAVFFLFFAVEFGVRGLLEEREEGTLARLLAAPIRPASVIGGKALASVAMGLVSTVLLVVATTWLLDATWGRPVGVASMVVAGVLAAVGVMALVATLATTTSQAGSYVSIVAVVGGLLGGTFFPISQAGPLGVLRFLSPQGWLMDGFRRLSFGASIAEIAGPLAAVLGIAMITGTIAWRRARRMMVR